MNQNNMYDIDEFYNEYIAMRESGVNANELMEVPDMKALLPDLKDKSILDLGCGYGEMSKLFITKGAKRVVACDISQKMINLAQKINGDEKIEFKVFAMEDLASLEEKFDMVYSSLAFHYIEDFDKLIRDISGHLNKDGILLFSQEHPLTTAPDLPIGQKKKMDVDGKRISFVSDYNINGKRVKIWNNTEKVTYHRNFMTTINTLINNGLEILYLGETQVREEAVKKDQKYIYQKDRPYFLYVKAKKK